MRVTTAVVLGVMVSAGAASASHGSPTEWVVISLDVPEERAPSRLCVMSRDRCGPDGKPCNNTAPLQQIEGYFAPRGDRPSRFQTPGATPAELPSEIDDALRLLAAPPSDTRPCSSGDYGACSPEVDLREFRALATTGQEAAGKLTGQIVCGSQRHAQSAERGRSPTSAGEPHDAGPARRVALLSLLFDDKIPDGIDSVVLEGTVARVHLTHKQSTRVTLQVIGGSYAVSLASAFAIDEVMTARLHPRCGRFFAEVPAHKARITAVELQHGSEHHRCVPGDPLASVIPVELPITGAAEDRSLTVRYEGGAISELRWFESLPPSPLRLAARAIRFSWQRPVGCLAERWREPTPPAEADRWSQTCPRAGLYNVAPCTLLAAESDDATCRYRCTIPGGQRAVSLPVAVELERVRSHPGAPSEVLYRWRDELDVADQELTSVVALPDRRVMLEFADPAQWKNRFGDEIDEIRVHSGQSANRLDLLDLDHTEQPPPWVSLPSAGRTCGDRVRVAITGSWRYLEMTADGHDGRIELGRPDAYRKRAMFYGLAGTGQLFRHLESNARSATFGELGLGLQIDLARWLRSLMLDIEASGQVTHTFYEGIELTSQATADFTAVPYLRFDLRVAAEWWWLRRVGVAAGLGIGLGTPVNSDDARMVGALRRSEVVELQPVLFALSPTRLWFLAGAGLLAGEQHRDYHTDFLGSPTPDQQKDAQWYVFLRFRAALE